MSYGVAGSYGIPGSGGGTGTAIPEWSALPEAAEGARTNATLGGVPVVAERGEDLWHLAYPTKASLTSLWPTADQFTGTRIGPMAVYWQAIAEQRPIKILVQGDSNSVGQGATVDNINCRAYAWPVLLAAELGWRDGCAFCLNLVEADSRIVSDGWVRLVKSALGAAWYTGDAGADLSFTPAVPFDRLIVTGLATNDGGTSTVYVDNVSVGTLNHNTGLNGGKDLPQVIVSVTRGLHTIRVTSNGGGNCFTNTFETYDSQSPVPDLLLASVADANLNDLVADSSGWEARWRLRQLGIDLGIPANTINDLDDNWTVEDVKAGLTIQARNLREAGGAVLGICGWATDRPNITKEALDQLWAHILLLSEADGTAAVDHRGSMGYTYATTNPLYVSDAWHPSAAGQAVMATQAVRPFK